MMTTSAVIPTYNSANTVESAIQSVTWCDEIILVDSFSTDSTRDIASSYGAQIIDDPTSDDDRPVDAYRKIGVENATHDIVVCLDADESHPASLQKRLREILNDGEAQGTMIRAPRLNFLGDEPLRGAGKWPDYTPVMLDRSVINVLRRSHVWWDASEGRTIDLPAEDEFAIRHEFVDSVYENWQAQRRYAKLAGNEREFSPLKLFLAPPWGFYTRYIKNDGWKCGLAGFGISLTWSWFLFETQLRAGIKTLREWS